MTSRITPIVIIVGVIVLAYIVGVALGSFDMTTTYLKQRKQFGKLIGEFQALQHRAAHLSSELEIARAAVIKAL